MFEKLSQKLGFSPVVHEKEHVQQSTVLPSKQTSNQSVPKDEYHCVDSDSPEKKCSDYRTLMTGVRVEKHGVQSSVNGIDVEKLLQLFALRPTKPAEQYLRGIKAKVDLLLQEQSANVKNHEHLVAVAQKIERAIKESTGHSRLHLLVDRDSSAAVS